jgi:molybdopterin synthase sulfur carrier subunit
MQVNFYATLRQIVGSKTIEVSLEEGETIRQLLDRILELYPLLRPQLLDEHGNLHGHVHIIVGGRDVQFLEDSLDTELKPGDMISVFPAVGGG